MAKLGLNPELEDLKKRLEQFKEINNQVITVDSDQDTGWQGVSAKTLAEIQSGAYQTVLELIKQIGNSGKVYRGNDYVPDAIEVILEQIK